MTVSRELAKALDDKRAYYVSMEQKLTVAIYQGLLQASNRANAEARALLNAFTLYCKTFPNRDGLRPEYRTFLQYADPTAQEDLLRMARRLPDEEQKRAIQEVLSKAQAWTYKEAYKAKLDMLRAETMARLVQDSRPLLDTVAREGQARASFEIVKQTRAAWAMNTPPKAEINAILANGDSSRWIKKSTKYVTDSMYHLAVEGIASGRHSSDIAEELHEMRLKLEHEGARVTESEKWRSRFMARTMTVETANQAEAEGIKKAGLKRYQFICNLDEATCEICGRLDGQVFEIDERNETNMPPLHPNCRCMIVAYIPPKYRKGSMRGAQIGEANGGASSYTQVPASMTYSEWKEKYGPQIPTYDVKTKKFVIE